MASVALHLGRHIASLKFSGDFKTFKYLLKSEEVSSFILKDEDLIKQIFTSEWNTQSGTFNVHLMDSLRPTSGPKKTIDRARIKHLPGAECGTPEDWMKNAFNASEDRDTGFLTLTSETADPSVMLRSRTVTETDRLLKERYIESSGKLWLLSAPTGKGTR